MKIPKEIEQWKIIQRDAEEKLKHYQKHQEFWENRLEEADDILAELQSLMPVKR